MKTKLLIVIGMLVFGFGNIFYYLPISFSLLDNPFPFDHIQLIFKDEDITKQIGYMPLHEAMLNPYWLS